MAMDIDSVLNVMRQEHAPSAADKARVRAALSAALVVGGAAQLGTTAGAKGISAFQGATWALPVWVKGTVGIGAAIAAVGGGVYGVREYTAAQTVARANVAELEAQSAARSAAASSPYEDPRHEEVRPATTPAEMQPRETLLAEPEAVTLQGLGDPRSIDPQGLGSQSAGVTKPPSGSAKSPPMRATTARGVAPADVGHTTTSLDELRLLGEASKALREGRTEQVRSVLSEHERRYSNTALAPERVGLELLARCTDSSSPEVRRAALEFLRRSPNSPLAGNIRRKCLE